MAIKRIRIDYTVYSPNYHPGDGCWDLQTLENAKRKARGLGPGTRIYRNFNQTNKRGQILGDWWTGNNYWPQAASMLLARSAAMGRARPFRLGATG
jgi:hypothetical protein